MKETEREEAKAAAKRKAEEEEKMGRIRRAEARAKKEEAEREKREKAREQRRLEREERERLKQEQQERERCVHSKCLRVTSHYFSFIALKSKWSNHCLFMHHLSTALLRLITPVVLLLRAGHDLQIGFLTARFAAGAVSTW